MKGESVDPIRDASNKRNKAKPESLSTAMDGSNGASIAQDKLSKLKKLFPEIFTEGKVDPEKLRLAIGEDLNIQNERYVLNWAGKSDAFRVLQTPTTATLAPTSEGIGDANKTGNVFIEGENLEVLKILQKSYYGKIKMIYIDPPYNTGSDNFIYPDRFSESKEEYLKRIGEKDEEGYLLKEGLFRKNSKESGQYHSNWLSMMYPRLFLARNLLKDDGVIFVSIDDNEVHNLRLLMNEVFGEENFLANIVWQKIHSTKNDAKYLSDDHEYVLLYAKNILECTINLLPRTEQMDNRYQNPDNDPRGPWSSGDLVANEERKDGYYDVKSPKTKKTFNVPKGKHWVYSQENMKSYIKEGRIWFGKDGNAFPRLKRYLSEVQQGKKADTLWLSDEVGHNQEATRETKSIFDDKTIFDTPKPVRLITQMLKLTKGNDDIILDFFAGSGTTAHAVLDLNKEDGGNRKFICVQLPEKTKNDSEAFNAGYKTIADICKERIRRVIKKIKKEKQDNPSLFKDKTEMDLGFKVFKLKNSNFKIWRSDVIENGKDLAKQMDVFEEPVKPEAKASNMVWEILLKSGYDLNTKVEEIEMPKQVRHDKKDSCEVYSASEGEVIIALSKISQSAIKEIIKLKPKRCICLDSLFAGNDQLKTNTVLQMKDAGIEFKTI
ncbi:MAG: site-specific DNA-methyltransferase [Planctomycetota bacterium]